MGTTMQALAWLMFLALGVFYFSDLLDKQHNPNQNLHTSYGEEGALEVVLQQDIPAGITPGLQSEQVLLGMSFLKHIEFTQRGDTLILRY